MSTGIEWTDETWNPTSGCDRVSPGCDNCYALTMAKRLKAMGQADYQTDGDPKTSGPGFGLAMHPHRLDLPLRWKKPRKVFVNSMSDLFHTGVDYAHIAKVFAVMALAPQHTFQILTKRHARMRSLIAGGNAKRDVLLTVQGIAAEHGLPEVTDIPWPLPNVWLGVSVESQQWADIRIPALLMTPAAVRFLSCEPLLGPVDLTQHMPEVPYWDARETEDWGIHWVIVGGESGRNARPMHPDWARTLRNQCVAAGVPFLFKQFGEWTPDGTGQHRITETRSRYEVRILGPNGEPWANDTIPNPSWAWLYRKGKKAAGRELDGHTWDQYPQAVTA